ncbi:MAG: hypothetical protein QOF97_2725 [Acidimicrobiaceae bacterium]
MRFRAVAIVLVLAACSGSGSPTAAPTTTVPTTTSAPTTAPPPPTTVSPLTAIVGCPDAGPYAAPDLRRPTYTAAMTVHPESGTVDGSLTVRFTADLPTPDLVFRLWANAPVVASSGSHIEVGPFAGGLTMEQPDPTTVIVHLATPLSAGDSVTVAAPFTLTVPGPNDDRVARDGDTMRLGSVLPMLAWEPGVGWATDPPTTVHAEATTSPAADYDVAIDVSSSYDVLATGVEGEDHHWRAAAVRDFALSIGHFDTASAVVDGISVTVGVDSSVTEDPNVQLALITDALHAYAGRFGPYPWPSYTVAVTPGFHGGIEFPNHVMQAPGSAARSVVHEVAHQWFYSLVGNDQARDPWLDEALASYVEFVEQGTLGAMAARGVPDGVRGHAGDPMSFWEGRDSSYYAGVYVQGAVALASLGTVDQVDCALRAYVAGNAYRIATPVDLLGALTPSFADAEAQLAATGVAIRR